MKAQVVAPYIVSFGTLPQVEYELKDNSLVTNISLGDLSVTPDTTVSEIALAIVKNNDGWEYDDCLEFMVVRQSEGNPPTAKCSFTHLPLDKYNSAKLSEALVVRNVNQIELGSSAEGFLQIPVFFLEFLQSIHVLFCHSRISSPSRAKCTFFREYSSSRARSCPSVLCGSW